MVFRGLVQGGARRWWVATAELSYHCTSWLKTYSGCGCARASLPSPTHGVSRVGLRPVD